MADQSFPGPRPADITTCPLRRDRLLPQFCDIIPSTIAALDAVTDKVMGVVESACCAPEKLDAVELALREALANAILHGNRSDSTKRVLVACYCEAGSDGGLLLLVRDQGPGFDPAAVPDPTTAEVIYAGHGRGIFLMRQIMDQVRYRNGGCEVELRQRAQAGRERGCPEDKND